MIIMPTFSEVHPTIPVRKLSHVAREATPGQVEDVLNRGYARDLKDFATLLSPLAGSCLETLAQQSQQITQRHFGKAIRLFAPIYLSNECVNVCKYCGFSRHLDIPRITIPLEQAVRETRILADQGFRSMLIVAGEHPKYVSNGYVVDVVRECLNIMPGLAIELGPMRAEGYIPIVEAGCEGLTVYQETYHREIYKNLHPSGPKSRFEWRMDTPERGYEAGFRRIGIGALFGLANWLEDAIHLAAHARYLTRKLWKAQITVAFPRMRPAAGGFQVNPANCLGDRELVQLTCAFRLLLPHAGIVLSTREPAHLRDGLVKCGVTMMSAGSSTEPGGYSSYDTEHFSSSDKKQEGEQFHIADERTPDDVASMIRNQGYEPVWKDFDSSLVKPVSSTKPAMASHSQNREVLVR